MDINSFFNELVNIVVRERGSDLHISSGRRPVIRVAGVLYPMIKQPELTKDVVLAILKILINEEKIKKFIAEQEIDFS